MTFCEKGGDCVKMLDIEQLHEELKNLRKEVKDIQKIVSDHGTCSKVTSNNKDCNNILSILKAKYGNGFTLHGLNYVYSGRTVEKIFWEFILLNSIAWAGYGLAYLTARFYAFEASQSLVTFHPLKIVYPALRICDFDAMRTKFLSYSGTKFDGVKETPWKIKLVGCRKVEKLLKDRVKCNTTLETELDGACLTLNPHQTEFQHLRSRMGAVHYLFEFQKIGNSTLTNPSANMDFSVHNSVNPPVYNSDFNNIVQVEGGIEYVVEVAETRVYDLLPPPYHNAEQQCFPELSAHMTIDQFDKFPCLQTCTIFKQLKLCGDVNDLWKSYVPPALKSKFRSNKTEDQIRKCVMNVDNMKEIYEGKICPQCFEPCKRTVYNVKPVAITEMNHAYLFDVPNDDPNQFIVSLFHRDIEYEKITESPAYPWLSFVAEFGGFLSLLTGCSAISVVEIVLFLLLVLAQRVSSLCKVSKQHVSRKIEDG